ncbi:SF0329 family protein [Bacillus sp. Hm123]|uniref:SF0329 family protein n=1 Tax=Bacillus sp. Hm123 TaxID=3450745 RepID=UPI003F439724
MHRKWSKVKKQLDGLICDSLRERILFQVTNYRKAHDQMGRVFIRVDQKEVISMCSIKTESEINEREYELRDDDDIYNRSENLSIQEQARKWANADGYFEQTDFFQALDEYFSVKIEQALRSTNPLVKMLAVIDRRTGKRTLLKLQEQMEEEHPFVKYMYELRMGIN